VLCRLEGLGKSFDGRPVLTSVSFTVAPGEIVSIVGPSGVGKTTLLTLIAGLAIPDAGRIVFDPPPGPASPVILVFQDWLLFPHISVFDNVAFGLKARRLPRAEVKRRVAGQLDYFGLSDKAHDFPAELSAGQKQRVALARALVVQPALLLLDEPFANLDRNLRLSTAAFIKATQRAFGISLIAVTHDLEEAFAMSDRLGVMLGGRLAQLGSVAEIYHRPASLEVARFLGPVNRIPAALARELGASCPGGEAAEVFARPEGLTLTPDPAGPAEVLEQVFAGHYIVYRVRLRGRELTVYSLSDGLVPGDRARLACHASFTHTEEPS
jgi:putative spermidine/putrescine transport system ATP-binding protein